MKRFSGYFKYVYLICGVMWWFGLTVAFSVVPSGRISQVVMRSRAIRVLHAVADPPMKDDTQKTPGKHDDMDPWIPAEHGGFLPNLRSRFRRGLDMMRRSELSDGHVEPDFTPASHSEAAKPSKIVQVMDIHQYKTEVADEEDHVVCVRFYAPWCKSCKAIEASFRRMPQAFSGYPVKFVECPVTKDNAYLHKGLGVPSLPFGHIYHPLAGLVEEQKISKHVFDDFQKVLWTYAQGECPVTFDNEGNCVLDRHALL
jgi:thiol-disulfide isomerase/thioredoxin